MHCRIWTVCSKEQTHAWCINFTGVTRRDESNLLLIDYTFRVKPIPASLLPGALETRGGVATQCPYQTLWRHLLGSCTLRPAQRKDNSEWQRGHSGAQRALELCDLQHCGPCSELRVKTADCALVMCIILATFSGNPGDPFHCLPPLGSPTLLYSLLIIPLVTAAMQIPDCKFPNSRSQKTKPPLII